MMYDHLIIRVEVTQPLVFMWKPTISLPLYLVAPVGGLHADWMAVFRFRFVDHNVRSKARTAIWLESFT